MKGDRLMKLETIILCYEPDKSIDKLVRLLDDQVLRPEQIHIVLTRTENVDRNVLQAMLSVPCKITEIEKKDFSHGATRQMAAKESCADYIMFMTQDAVPYDRFLTKRLVDRLEAEPKAAVAYARQLPKKDAPSTERFARLYNYPKKNRSQILPSDGNITARTIFCSDTCSVYRKSTFEKLGGFESVDFNEDAIFAYKAIKTGHSVEYCANAIVYHSHDLKLKQQYYRYKANAKAQKASPEVYKNIHNESEGLKFVKSGTRFFLKRNDLNSLFRFYTEAVVKYCGYFIGRYIGR